jgi:hypothetical protein
MLRASRPLAIVAATTILALGPSAWATGEQIADPEGAAPAASEAAPTEAAPQPEETPEPEGVDTPVAEEGARSHVALARFTTAVENREPVDAVTFLENDATRIYFYTDLRDLSGETIVHRWELGGEVMAEVPFAVGSDRWRVWSSKRLLPAWTGDWTVAVVKGDGEVIASESFTFQPKP